MATKALPVVAEERKSELATFMGRGRYERLTMGYVTIEAGATKPFSVLHISDTHLTAVYDHEPEPRKAIAAQRTQTFGGLQEVALRDSLAWARENCDYVLHTGDLIDWQGEANYSCDACSVCDAATLAGDNAFLAFAGEIHRFECPAGERRLPASAEGSRDT